MSKTHAKKSVAWDKDPDILARLNIVASMMNQGAKVHQIASSLACSISTANRDVARVKELWRRASKGEIEDKRAEVLAGLEEIKLLAYDDYRAAKQEKRGGMAALRLALDAQKEIAAVLGVKITNIDLTSKGEKISDARAWTDDELAALLAAAQK
jgi:Trp operon repressor